MGVIMGYKLNSERSNIKEEAPIMNNSIENIQEVGDMSQTIKELNDDTIVDKFTNIDMKTNLKDVEINGILVVDSLRAMGFLPFDISNLTRSKKRISVSKGGKGREDIVRIAQGMQEESTGTSFFSKMGNMFRGK